MRHLNAISAPTTHSVIRTVGGARKPNETMRSIRRAWRSYASIPIRRRSAAAYVFAADKAQVITEMRPQFTRPLGIGRVLPGRGRLHVGRDEVIQRDIAAIGPTGQARGLKAHGRAEAPRAQDAGHRGERRNVLVVVPVVEFGLGGRLD